MSPSFVSRISSLLAFMFLVVNTKAWVPPSLPVQAASTTELGMFDWFNPKPAPEPPAPVPEPPAPAPEASAPAPAPPTPAPAEAKEKEPVPVVEEMKTTVAATTTRPDSTAVQSGKVRWYNPRKGFGFIKSSAPEDVEAPEVFVHQTAIQADGFRSLTDGESVEYRLEIDDQGRLFATHVTGPDGGDVRVTIRRREREESGGEQ